ncbi:hypothetical protein AcW1_009791 [Taiwanofungus camphoratus]|nr:hypothetical protein AcW1_009791 [Antrodia cinnamomea]
MSKSPHILSFSSPTGAPIAAVGLKTDGAPSSSSAMSVHGGCPAHRTQADLEPPSSRPPDTPLNSPYHGESSTSSSSLLGGPLLESTAIVPEDSQRICRPSPYRGGGNEYNGSGDSLTVPMPLAHAGSAWHTSSGSAPPNPCGLDESVCEPDSSDGASAPPFGTLPASQPIERPDSPMMVEADPSHTPSFTADGDNLRDEPTRPVLTCISANVQKSAENMSILLERHRDANIICVQEIFWGRIKDVASAKSREGEAYENTSAHASFKCLRASKDSRVAIYVNKRWASASPQVVTHSVSHKDCLLVALKLPSGDFNVLNVYNDSTTFDAVRYLETRVHVLSPIACMCRDFNLRHPLWDTCAVGSRVRPPHYADSNCLIELAQAELDLVLMNAQDGPVTWRSHNIALTPGVIDLMWIDPVYYEGQDLHVFMSHHHNSDHAVLRWEIPIEVEPEPVWGIPRTSDAAQQFVTATAKLFADYPTHFSSAQGVERMGDCLERDLQRLWMEYSSVKRPSK